MILGEHQLSSSTETSLTTAHAVAAIVAHPAYDQPRNDLALLKLSTKVSGDGLYRPHSNCKRVSYQNNVLS